MSRVSEFLGIKIYMYFSKHGMAHFHAIYGPSSLRLLFDDGTRKRVNVLPLLKGRTFEPLYDPTYFKRVTVDPIGD